MKNWLHAEGVDLSHVDESSNGDFISAILPSSTVEILLGVPLYNFHVRTRHNSWDDNVASPSSMASFFAKKQYTYMYIYIYMIYMIYMWYTYIYICIYIYFCSCICMKIHIHVYVYAHTHTHTHTHTTHTHTTHTHTHTHSAVAMGSDDAQHP